MGRDLNKVVVDVAVFAASQIALFYAVRYVLSSMDPQKSDRKMATKKGQELLSSLKSGDIDLSNLELDEYEQAIAGEIVPPSSITTTFESIGGLEDVISQLRETVIYPLTYPELFRSQGDLLAAPKGVLLYGHPGCGKTMIAKALAKESGATFINLPLSSLMSKWLGESNKIVAGLFSLATKLQPSIIFIDEIDSLFRSRSTQDHEVTGMIKAEFMTMWDGLTSGDNARVMVLGATNRPNDIDPAILRRMPKKFAIRLPNYSQRLKILTLMLTRAKLSPGFDLAELARITEGLSGSDLKETCRNAAMLPVREMMREREGQGIKGMEDAKKAGFNLRPLKISDFVIVDSHAYSHVDPSGGRRTRTTGNADLIEEPLD